ncbi:MAG: response regulator [Thermomicrobiales bacterium]
MSARQQPLREAWDLMASNLAIDVALIDLQLPDGSGTELLRELRRSGSGARAIVLTGSADPLDRARAVDAGAAYVLHKSSGSMRSWR